MLQRAYTVPFSRTMARSLLVLCVGIGRTDERGQNHATALAKGHHCPFCLQPLFGIPLKDIKLACEFTAMNAVIAGLSPERHEQTLHVLTKYLRFCLSVRVVRMTPVGMFQSTCEV